MSFCTIQYINIFNTIKHSSKQRWCQTQNVGHQELNNKTRFFVVFWKKLYVMRGKESAILDDEFSVSIFVGNRKTPMKLSKCNRWYTDDSVIGRTSWLCFEEGEWMSQETSSEKCWRIWNSCMAGRSLLRVRITVSYPTISKFIRQNSEQVEK